MDPVAPASFIPKSPLVETGRAKGGGGGLFLLLGLLIFVASALSAGGAFVYKGVLDSGVASKADSLKKGEDAFTTGTIEELVRLDTRIKESRNLFGTHIAPSSIFDFLSTATLERVQFTGFDYQINGDGAATITLSGIADTFATVALQSDQFGGSKILRDVLFSGITIDASGRVLFVVKASVDPNFMLYRKRLSSTPIDAGSPTVEVPLATTSVPTSN